MSRRVHLERDQGYETWAELLAAQVAVGTTYTFPQVRSILEALVLIPSARYSVQRRPVASVLTVLSKTVRDHSEARGARVFRGH